MRRGGPPYSFQAEIAAPGAGNQRIELRRGDKLLACRTIAVKKSAKDRSKRPAEGVYWKSTRRWDRATENLFSAWVEALFDAPVAESLSFRPLAPALRDPKRNFLYDHLSLREDDPKNKEALPAEPDCADLPYFLRAYFAWKLGLPVGFRDCNRGSPAARAPRCGELITNEAPAEGKTRAEADAAVPAQAGQHRALGQRAHGAGDEETDLYPVPLTREALRPGTVYADPYGHVLVLVKWVPQSAVQRRAAAGGGRAARRQRRRASASGRGRSCSPPGEKSAGPGWKAFRPLVPGGEGGALAPLTNDAAGQGWRPRRGFARVLGRAGQDLGRRLLRAHEQAHQSAGPAAAAGLRGDAGRAGRAAGDPGGLGGQRRGLHEADHGRGGADARGAEDLRDRGALGGLRHPVAGHAPDHRHERAGRACPSGSCSTPSCSCWAGASPTEAEQDIGRPARQADQGTVASNTSAATVRRSG